MNTEKQFDTSAYGLFSLVHLFLSNRNAFLLDALQRLTGINENIYKLDGFCLA